MKRSVANCRLLWSSLKSLHCNWILRDLILLTLLKEATGVGLKWQQIDVFYRKSHVDVTPTCVQLLTWHVYDSMTNNIGWATRIAKSSEPHLCFLQDCAPNFFQVVIVTQKIGMCPRSQNLFRYLPSITMIEQIEALKILQKNPGNWGWIMSSRLRSCSFGAPCWLHGFLQIFNFWLKQEASRNK